MQIEEYTTGTQGDAHKVLQVGSSIDVAICRDAPTAILIARLLNEYNQLPLPEDLEREHKEIILEFQGLQFDPKPHNPDGLESPGEGYRFLDEDETKQRSKPYDEIEVWFPGIKDWRKGCIGFNTVTYRTKLSREELAKLV